MKKNLSTITNNQSGNLVMSVLLILLVALAVGCGIFLLAHHQSKPKPTANQPYLYSYSKLDSYTLKGDNHSGIAIQKPVELVVPKDVSFSPGQILFIHNQTNPKGYPVTMATVAIASSAAQSPDQTYLDGLNKSVKSANIQQYQPLADSLKKYVTDRAGPYTFKFGKPESLTTDNIKTNDFSISFSASPSSNGSKYGFQPIQGTAIMAFGRNGSYYISLYSIDYNWTTNSSIWDKVINSIKIDQ